MTTIGDLVLEEVNRQSKNNLEKTVEHLDKKLSEHIDPINKRLTFLDKKLSEHIDPINKRLTFIEREMNSMRSELEKLNENLAKGNSQ